MKFTIKNCHLEQEQTDCIVVNIFEKGEFSSGAKYLDQCSNGHINSLIKLGDIKGKIGETMMIYNIPKIFSKRILLVGCGKKNVISRQNMKKILRKTINTLKTTSVKNVIFSFTELNLKIKDNLYWMIRLIVLTVKNIVYNIVKINHGNKKIINLDLIILNFWTKEDSFIAKKSLKHALAINYGITCTKNLSNLPPNICNPLYLSHQAQQLSKKYKNNIIVEVVDTEEMKNLGMNAYVSVGCGSKNKPFMSIIKYTGNTLINDQVIALVGKGVTFDSGGISIKPSFNMHEMKYDMCGAAAVYGTMIVAAELCLPLTIIGILSGCENMPGSSAFRPGDVLTTMSGQTVEILNTDAEGRLVLCDSLTYVERFSPNVVIDIATLTGACVTSLGSVASGMFTNNEDLANELNIAANETDDKIWRLPLHEEYKKDLKSSVADLSSTGKSKAGAIIAASFLSFFTNKYTWAHLDIAGTAWKPDNKGATGRPIELLCQFLLNKIKNLNN